MTETAWDLFTAPVNGFADAAEVAAAILVSGGLIAVLTKVGAMDAGIGALLRKFKGSTLIIILMIVFSLMGTVYGAWEEMPAYAILILPLFVAAGYDSITGFMVIMIATVAGNMADVVNPYAVGAAVAAIGNPELSIGHGILLRLVLYVVLLVMGILYVLRYAKKVKANPESSPVYGIEMNLKETDTTEVVEFTPRRVWSLVVFGIVILLCVLGYVPWDSIETANGTVFDSINAFKYALSDSVVGKFLGLPNFTEFAWWYFVEFSAVWLLGAVVIGFINKMPEKEWVKTPPEESPSSWETELQVCPSPSFTGSRTLSPAYLSGHSLSLQLLHTCSSVSSCSPPPAYPESRCLSSELLQWHSLQTPPLVL